MSSSTNNYSVIMKSNDTNFAERVKALKTVLDKTETQPESLLFYFEDVKDQEDPMLAADMIAQAYKEIFGPIIIGFETSYCLGNGKVLTIMDEFELNEGDQVSNWLLERAFKKAGFKRGSDHDQKQLMIMYNANPHYRDCFRDNRIWSTTRDNRIWHMATC